MLNQLYYYYFHLSADARLRVTELSRCPTKEQHPDKQFMN
jgi:hypothetical protein